MSREFIIGAMDLTPYFLRTVVDRYEFRDVPVEMVFSLISYWNSNCLIAIYVNPKICFSTLHFTCEPYANGVEFRAYHQAFIYKFFILSPKKRMR